MEIPQLILAEVESRNLIRRRTWGKGLSRKSDRFDFMSCPVCSVPTTTHGILQSALAPVSQETREGCVWGETRALTTKKSLCPQKICSGSRRMETNPLTSQDFSGCRLFANFKPHRSHSARNKWKQTKAAGELVYAGENRWSFPN